MNAAAKMIEKEQPIAADELRFTPIELAQFLMQNPSFELTPGKKLIIHNMDVTDFIDASTTQDFNQRLLILNRMMARHSIEISLSGSVELKEFGLNDHSWMMTGGVNEPLKFAVKPVMLKKSIKDLVAFLNLLPHGQGFALKVNQDLFVEGLSADAMLDYYHTCQNTTDLEVREKEQDALFAGACDLLGAKKLAFKIYGFNVVQIDRNIDVNASGILFRPVGNSELTTPAIVLALLRTDAK